MNEAHRIASLTWFRCYWESEMYHTAHLQCVKHL